MLWIVEEPMTLPIWSPYAVIAGILVGFVLGAITAGVYALRLQRLERLASRPDPARKVLLGAIVFPMPARPEPVTEFAPHVEHGVSRG